MKKWDNMAKSGIQSFLFARHLMFVVLLLTTWSGSVAAQVGPESALIARASRAVVQINTLGGTQHLGTGMVYAENGQILTVYSQVAGRNRFQVRMTASASEVAAPAFLAELHSYDVTTDLAVLRIYANVDGSALDAAGAGRALRSRQAVAPGVVMAPQADVPGLGDGAGVVGFPREGGGLLMYTGGVISSVQRGEVAGRQSLSRISTTAAVADGAAGGMVLDRRGRVAGMALAVGGESYVGPVFFHVLPIQAIRDVLASNTMTRHTYDVNMPEPERTDVFDITQNPNYGVIQLSAGFLPDPYEASALAGGDINAGHLENYCVGNASAAPDFRLDWTGRGDDLHIAFRADDSGDATLIIRLPDGSWSCNDDSEFGGFNPIVSIESAATGIYDIWIGTYNSDVFVQGTLRISEIYSEELVDAAGTGEALDPFSDPNYGQLDLAAGFRNDPATIEGIAGGPNDISTTMPQIGCFGHFSTAPDFRVQWTGSTQGLRMFFEATEEGEDSVILINTPDGQWLCNDDAHEYSVNPMLDLNGYGEGQYDIWVGSYNAGSFIQGVFSVTTTGRLPR